MIETISQSFKQHTLRLNYWACLSSGGGAQAGKQHEMSQLLGGSPVLMQ